MSAAGFQTTITWKSVFSSEFKAESVRIKRFTGTRLQA